MKYSNWSPDNSPPYKVPSVQYQISKVGNSESMAPVMVGGVSVSSLNHQYESSKAVTWYSPPKNSNHHRSIFSYGLPGDHAQVTEHGEHGCCGVRYRDYTGDETELVEV